MSEQREQEVSALANQICGCSDRMQHIHDCALIRTYGDERYQAAIADVVGWLEAQYAGRLQSPIFLTNEITHRFGKGQT